MNLAIAQAKLGTGQTSPNPTVGAVIVHGGEVISSGYHAKAGTPHAERVAIANAELVGFDQWSCSTLYVTLEPCSTHGRTGACTTAITERKFARVVYGSVDPNPDHVGNADTVLKEAGIPVTSRVLESDCDYLIRGFSKVQRKGFPWVAIKSAMSLDGKITRPVGEGQWLTSEDSRIIVHQIRSEVDAIITGGNTLRADNPTLTVRLPDRDDSLRQPLRIVFTRDVTTLPKGSILLQDDQTFIYETPDSESIEQALRDLAKNHGVNTVLLEAGGELMGTFFDAALIDEVAFFYAPILTGGVTSAVAGCGSSTLSESLKLRRIQYTKIGNDFLMRGVIANDS